MPSFFILNLVVSLVPSFAASRIVEGSQRFSKLDGIIQFAESIKLVKSKNDDGENYMVSQARNSEIFLVDNKKNKIASWKVPYGASVHVKDKQKIKTGDLLFTAVFCRIQISRFSKYCCPTL